MKNFMKGCAITALIMLIVGLTMAIIGGTVDGTAALGQAVERVTHGRVHMNFWDHGRPWGIFYSDRAPLYDIEDSSIVFDELYSILGGDIDKYALEGDIYRLDIEVGGCALYFEESKDDNFYVEASGIGKFQSYVKGNTLYVKSTDKSYRSASHRSITLYIPEDYQFDNVDISFGAGLVEIGDLMADKVSLEVGAGEITASYLEADQCSFEVGAGNIEINDMNVRKMDAEVGMGQIVLYGSIEEKADLECAMGNLELFLKGSENDFNYRLEASMGNVDIGHSSFSGISREKVINNHADKDLEIECSMGVITIYFPGT